jgi:hypothetical protein
LAVLLLLLVLSTAPAGHAASALTRSQSGLIAQDALNSAVTSRWMMWGNAIASAAPHSYMWNATGLYLSIQAIDSANWVGYFAKSSNTAAELFHAVLTIPYASVSSNSFDTGLYVQTSSPEIDYVACAAEASTSGHYWMVVSATGGATFASQFTVLYRASGGPLTEDCTIVTNGQNMLRVYLGGQLVYSSSSLNLQMPAPFNAFLEVQSTNPNALLYAGYQDYYAAAADSVKVTNVAQGDTVELVGPSNNVLASGLPAPNGTVTLPVGTYHMPLTASVEVFSSPATVGGGAAPLALNSGPLSIWGGDVYQASLASSGAGGGGGTSQLSVSSVNSAGTPIVGYYTTLWQGGALLGSCFSPCSFTVNAGQTYQVESASYGAEAFNHWQNDGSTGLETVTVPQSPSTISLTAVYKP